MTGRLDVEVALLELEVAFRAELAAARIVPDARTRAPFPHELRARVLFAELDRLIEEAAGLAARKADRVRTHVVDGIAEELAGRLDTEDPFEAVQLLNTLADPTRGDTIPGLRELVDEVTDELTEDLLATATASAREVAEEATRQGVSAASLPAVDPATDPAVRAAVRAAAQRVARHPVTRVLELAVEAGTRAAAEPGAGGADVLLAAIDAADSATTAGTEDLATQAASTAHGLGRQRFADAAPTPRQVYASELLDRNTCSPCSHVDGRTYATLADALVDYPGAGGFVGCQGGARCRGTLVYVWDTEAPPTRITPGDRPDPGNPPPPDLTPRGPASPAPAPPTGPSIDPPTGVPAIAPEGRVEPPPAVDDPTPAPVLPDSPTAPERDTTLDDVRTRDLEALHRGAIADGDYTTATRYADELDARAFGTSSYVDPDTRDLGRTWAASGDLDDLASDATDYAALEAGLADQVDDELGYRDTRPGRRIDHVKELWDEELIRAHQDAEAATTGYLINPARVEEFRARYGDTDVLFQGPARIGYYYASDELLAHWQNRPRLTFAEFAVQAGITDAKTVARARKAAEARQEAAARADEDPEARKRRKALADRDRRRRAGPLTEGQRLERAQRRAERERRKMEDLQRRAGGDT